MSGLSILIFITGRGGGSDNPSELQVDSGAGGLKVSEASSSNQRQTMFKNRIKGDIIMKKKLAILGTALMMAAAITACGDKDTEPVTTAAVTTTAQTDTTAAQENAAGEETTGKTEQAGSAESESEADDTEQVKADMMSEESAKMSAGDIKSFAEKVQAAVAAKDLEGLADMCYYPLYISFGEDESADIADKESFMELGADKLFTEALVKETKDTNTDSLEQFGAGVIMGNENNIIFNLIDGKTAITSIILN